MYFWEISLLYGILQDLRVSSVCLCIEAALTMLYKLCSWTPYIIVQQLVKSSKFAVVLFQVSVQHVVLLITMFINKLDPQKQFSPLHCLLWVSEIQILFFIGTPQPILPSFPASHNSFLCEPPECEEGEVNLACSCFTEVNSKFLIGNGNIHNLVCVAV